MQLMHYDLLCGMIMAGFEFVPYGEMAAPCDAAPWFAGWRPASALFAEIFGDTAYWPRLMYYEAEEGTVKEDRRGATL